METKTASYAEQELDLLSSMATDPENRPLIEPFRNEILALCEAFGKSGQSGGSASYTAGAIASAVKKLLLQKPICPVYGLDDEWVDVSMMGAKDETEVCYQNKRCGSVFKGDKTQPYYLDAIVWRGDTEGESGNTWDNFTGTVEGISSRQTIKSFPFEPKTFYIDVTREQLPEDWTEEPFIEGKQWYDNKEFEATGKKVWHKDKYRYKIKDHKQLEEVFKYYDRYE